MQIEILNSLKQRFIRELSSHRLQAILFGSLSGISVFYFLFIFGAYGINQGVSFSGHSHLFRSLSFGFLTAIYCGNAEYWLKPKFSLSSLKSELIWYAGLIILGSQLIFLLFNYFWNGQEWNVHSYALILKEFPLLMIFPLFITLLIRKLSTSEKVEPTVFCFQSENGKDQLHINISDFYYATSSENYICIHYTIQGQVYEHLIRKPLKRLEHELRSYPQIVKIHRSHLVNTSIPHAIRQQKGKVFLEINSIKLPVSKSYQDQFLKV